MFVQPLLHTQVWHPLQFIVHIPSSHSFSHFALIGPPSFRSPICKIECVYAHLCHINTTIASAFKHSRVYMFRHRWMEHPRNVCNNSPTAANCCSTTDTSMCGTHSENCICEEKLLSIKRTVTIAATHASIHCYHHRPRWKLSRMLTSLKVQSYSMPYGCCCKQFHSIRVRRKHGFALAAAPKQRCECYVFVKCELGQENSNRNQTIQ